LQFSSRKLANLSAQDLVQLQSVAETLLVVKLKFRIEHGADCHRALDRTRDVVDVLRLDQCLEVIFEDFGEVVLQLGATEVF
jgi:hypothetical protein